MLLKKYKVSGIKYKVHLNFCYVFCFLIFNILFIVQHCSAQAPKIKHVYKDKITYDGEGKEIKNEPDWYVDSSYSGKLLAEKNYYLGRLFNTTELKYDSKERLVRKSFLSDVGYSDSIFRVYSNNSDTVKEYHYTYGKLSDTSLMTFHSNGEVFWIKNQLIGDSVTHEFKYDTLGKLIPDLNGKNGNEYDKFGNMIQYSKDGATLYSKYSDDGKKFIEEELISINDMENYKYTYSYNKDGYLLKTVLYSNGYMSKKSATSKMVYSDSSVTTITYNTQNNKTSEYVYGKGDKITKETFYAYDKENRLIKETICKTVGLCTEVITYSYDKYGNTLEEAHYKGMNGSVLDWKYVYTYEFY